MILSEKKDCKFDIRYFTTTDITNESLPQWKREKRIRSYHSVLKKYNLSQSKESSLAKLIFRITLDLILNDMINFNYSFQLPHMNGGYIGIFDITNVEGMWRKDFYSFDATRVSRYYKPIHVNFHRNSAGRRIYKVRFSYKYFKMMMRKIKNGHIYPQKDVE